ncbi:MAG TPA: hypothetical protein VMU38_07770, partial [Candidatus Binatia bacterium]|nr:hypothetical protein [Candidatus Binatia bacterium]
SILYTETPSQHGIDGNQSSPNAQSLLSGSYSIPSKANAYYYDFDGNQVKVITHKGCSSNTSCSPTSKTVCTNENTNPLGTTCKYYDGLDRLVETAEPYDTRSFSGGQAYEFYTFRWMNRYIYDLSQAGGSAALTISDSTGTTNSFAAYGSLYKTKEFLPQISGMVASLNNGPYSSGGWSDVRGTSFDGLDRPLKKFELAFGTAPVTKNTYDASGQYDLLSQTTNAVGQITTYAYDHIDRLNQVTFSGTSPLADGRSYTYDADSRTATATNSQLGTLSYVYDVDGDMTSVTEPAQAGAQSLICYAYYPDGMRAYLGIGEPSLDSCGTNTNGITAQNPSNGGIRQPQIFSYAYTEDGLLGTQLVNWGSNHETFSWTYTPSQRETSETDPLYQQVAYQPPNGSTQIRFGEKTYQYDQYGRVSQLVFPAGYTESNPVYDYDDELAGYAQGVPQPTITRYLTLNARGELLGDFPQQNPPPGSTWAQGPTYSANGAQLGNGSFCTGTAPVQAPPNALQIDVRSNMVMAIVNPQCAQGNQNNWVYTYDGAGRQVAVQGISTTDYDAENHVSDTTASPPGSALWGPDTHQRVDTYGGAASTAHWDGDTILFSSLSSGSPILYIGKLATMDYTGDITVIDRDQSGAKVTAHGYQSGNLGLPPWITNGNWYDGWSTGTVRTLYVYKAQKTYPVQLFPGNCNVTDTQNNNYYTCPSNSDGAFAMKRADGYAMIGGLVQGARTYDPTSGQWLTPDPYAGDVRDPISQKPFMWNGNNPVEWNDPSGYCTDPPPGQPRNGCLGGIDWPLNMRFGNTLQGVLDFVVIPQARIEEIGFSLAERFGSGPTRMAFANLESGGLRGLQNGIKTLERRIAEHQEKISEAVERGGADSGNYISSMQTEMKAFENNLGALKALASDIENAVNEAAQVGGSLLRDSEKMY